MHFKTYHFFLCYLQFSIMHIQSISVPGFDWCVAVKAIAFFHAMRHLLAKVLGDRHYYKGFQTTKQSAFSVNAQGTSQQLTASNISFKWVVSHWRPFYKNMTINGVYESTQLIQHQKLYYWMNNMGSNHQYVGSIDYMFGRLCQHFVIGHWGVWLKFPDTSNKNSNFTEIALR